MIKQVIFIAALTVSAPAISWEGEDEDGQRVSIEKGNLVRRGQEIEYERDGETVTAEVESVRSRGRYVEVEVTDQAGESHTLEMEKR